MDEIEFFSKVLKLVEGISSQGLRNMLSTTEEVISHLIRTKHYKSIEEDIRDGTLTFRDVGELAKDFDPKHDINIVVWLTGFRAAASTNDPRYMLFQLSLYVAAQRFNVYRIQNDKIRLIMTYIHIEALQTLIK